jgi:hypothetical protein
MDNPMIQETPEDIKQAIQAAKLRAAEYLRGPIFNFFYAELEQDRNPVDSLLGFTGCVCTNLAIIIKGFELQNEQSTNEELAKILGESLTTGLLAFLNSCDKQRSKPQ